MLKKVANVVLRCALAANVYARKLGVKVGKSCRILTKDFGLEPFLINIGGNIAVSPGVTFLNHVGAGWLTRDEKRRRYSCRNISISKNCFIGANSTILPGVRIEGGVIEDAGSIVTRSISRGSVVAGNPAHKITDFEAQREKALGWISGSLLNKQLFYRERVLAVLDPTFKPPFS